MSTDRRAFLLGIGAAATSLALPHRVLARDAHPAIDLRTLLSIVGPSPGGTSWVESVAHVLEFTPARPPKVLFAEAAILECRLEQASATELAAAGLMGRTGFRIAVRGAARALEAGTHRPLERFTNAVTDRAQDVPVSRWQSNVLVTETEWVALDESPRVRRRRGAPQVADAGGEWCVFHAGAALGLEGLARGAMVESTGWRVRPADLRAGKVPAGYHHVCYSPVALRPWLGYDDDSPVRLLENATGHKLLEREQVSVELMRLLDP